MTSAPPAVIVQVQRFCLHDGPGIRTTVFFKGCPLRCRWCQNPEAIESRPELMVYEQRCESTGRCRGACPTQALDAPPVRVNRSRCQACGSCVERCPHGALQICGREVELEQLLEQVARDRPFYEASGGGITLSGGEPTLQLEFLFAFVERARGAGLDVGMQTAGAFSWQRVAPLLGNLAFIHYDLKIIDAQRHRDATGADNGRIIANARAMAQARLPVRFRVPVVPAMTDDEDNLAAIAALLAELEVGEVVLLPYHRMGDLKAKRLGRPRPELISSRRESLADSMRRACQLFQDRGIHAHERER